MKCKQEATKLMHKYLDGELTKEEEGLLRSHLQSCEACQRHFHELKRTITLINSTEHISASQNFTKNVMRNLPKEKKRVGYRRWFKAHPIVTAAAIFFLFMFGGVFSAWNQEGQVTVSKQQGLIIQESTVIVPEGVTVEGDLVVKNGDLEIKGTVDGDVVLINGKYLNEELKGDALKASAGGISGDLKQVNQVFEWVWYQMKSIAESVFSLGSSS